MGNTRLRMSDVNGPGIRRVPSGRGFRYLDPAGHPITDPEEKDRLRWLVIPPAWRDVWICPWSNGNLQATGTDSAGRGQYLYTRSSANSRRTRSTPMSLRSPPLSPKCAPTWRRTSMGAG
ncbi:hypothetical protein [Streptomyces sp. NBC_01435]|uniref:hypothetical protein n=1 Tax=Streptomyces sp. NBC_01435 TaxID=2903865 RepID=UPI002E2F213E|nr:hypothetical protein [Streptomyces sp. NBC_01435]